MVERSLDINDLVVKNPTSTFFVRVEGDSMEGAGIFSGDVLVVDRSVTARSGHIVVAAINGEMVVKRLQRSEGSNPSDSSRSFLELESQVRGKTSNFVLVSEQEGYAPIAVSEDENCTIWGVVVGSIRQFQ